MQPSISAVIDHNYAKCMLATNSEAEKDTLHLNMKTFNLTYEDSNKDEFEFDHSSNQARVKRFNRNSNSNDGNSFKKFVIVGNNYYMIPAIPDLSCGILQNSIWINYKASCFFNTSPVIVYEKVFLLIKYIPIVSLIDQIDNIDDCCCLEEILSAQAIKLKKKENVNLRLK